MELAFAGLHQLCAAIADRLEPLPAPQRDALRTVLGISAGPAPDPFLVGLAVLNLLSEVAQALAESSRRQRGRIVGWLDG